MLLSAISISRTPTSAPHLVDLRGRRWLWLALNRLRAGWLAHRHAPQLKGSLRRTSSNRAAHQVMSHSALALHTQHISA